MRRNSFFHFIKSDRKVLFIKSDRKVLVLLLVLGLAVVTVLVLLLPPKQMDESQRIEKPEHWWENK